MTAGNVITNKGKVIILHRGWTVSPTYNAPSKFMVGTGTTTPAVTQAALTTPVNITGSINTKSFDLGYPTFAESTAEVAITCTLLSSEAVGNSIAEFGLFNTDTTAKMFSRCVFTAIAKDDTVQIVFNEDDQMA